MNVLMEQSSPEELAQYLLNRLTILAQKDGKRTYSETELAAVAKQLFAANGYDFHQDKETVLKILVEKKAVTFEEDKLELLDEVDLPPLSYNPTMN